MPLSHFVTAYPSPSPCPQVHSLVGLCVYSVKDYFKIIISIFHQFLSFLLDHSLQQTCLSVTNLNPLLLTSHPSSTLAPFWLVLTVKLLKEFPTVTVFTFTLPVFPSGHSTWVVIKATSEMTLTKVFSDFHLAKSNGGFSVSNSLEPSLVFDYYILLKILSSLFF